MEWGPEPSVRWKPPLRVVCGAWERERGDSLSLTGKKKRIAHRVSVDQPSLCAVVQSAAAGWRKKIGGGGGVHFVCGIRRVGFCQNPLAVRKVRK